MPTKTPSTMPWYKSKIIVGAVISVITKVLVMSGLVSEISPEDSDNLANLIVLIAGSIGDLTAIGARLLQKRAPEITVTKKE